MTCDRTQDLSFQGKLSLEYIRELSTDVLEVLLSANSTPDKHRQNTKNNICIRHTRKIVVGFLLFLLDCIVEDLSVWTIHSIHLPNFDLGGNIPRSWAMDRENLVIIA